jgi:signal peptidase
VPRLELVAPVVEPEPVGEVEPTPEPRAGEEEPANERLYGWAPDELPRSESWDLVELGPLVDLPPEAEREPVPSPAPALSAYDLEPVETAPPQRSVAGRLLTGALWAGSALSILVLLAIGVGPHTGLYRTMTVLSGSMRPTFSAGDMIVSTPEPIRDVRVGQIVTYQIPVLDHHVETHRIVKILSHGASPVVITKGDANRVVDPWKAKLHGTTIWRVRATIPLLGWLVYWLRLPQLHRIVILLVPSLLSLVWLVGIWSAPSRPRRDDFSEVAGA